MHTHGTLRRLGMLLGLLAAVGLAGAGCKKDEKDGDKSEKSEKSDKDKGEKKSGKFACCDGSKTFGSCKQYNEGNLEIGEEPLRKLCDAVKGTFKPEKCPAENRVGVCTKPEGTDVYYSGTEVPNDVVKLEKYCTEGGGKWSK